MALCVDKYVNRHGKMEKLKEAIDKMVKFYTKRKIFTSENQLINQVSKHERRCKKTAKTSLNFKSPNEIVAEYFSKCSRCLDI